MSGRASGRSPLAKVRLDGLVGRSRYAEDSQVLAARINLHEHTLINETCDFATFREDTPA